MRVGRTDRFDRELLALRNLRGGAFDTDAFITAIEHFEADKPLPMMFKDHALHAEWQGFREFHIGDDDLVVYQIIVGGIVLRRAGTHQQLFGDRLGRRRLK